MPAPVPPDVLPLDVDALTPEWFSSVLQRDVTDAELLDRHSGTTGRAKVGLRGAPDLPAHHYVIPGDARAGDADLRRQDVVLADAAVVRNLHQVVDLRSLADERDPEGRAVDRGIGPDLHVVSHLDAA